jgi:signal peptidase II
LGRGTLNKRALAICLAAVTLIMNFIFQRALMNTGVEGRTLIAGFADFHPAWNNGVSFSLLAQSSDTGRYLLIAVLTVISIAVAAMAWRATNTLAAAGFGLVLGGALGNLMDRLQYGGAVFDFLALHLGSLPLFVCNLADIWISAGVVLLFLDSLVNKPAREIAR